MSRVVDRRRLACASPGGRPRPDAWALPNVTVLCMGPNAEPDTNALPPDPSGDIGPTQYLLAVNGRIRTHAKSTGAADGVLDSHARRVLRQSVRNGQATSKPRVRYDRRAGRWIVTDHHGTAQPLPGGGERHGDGHPAAPRGLPLPWSNTRTQGGGRRRRGVLPRRRPDAGLRQPRHLHRRQPALRRRASRRSPSIRPRSTWCGAARC